MTKKQKMTKVLRLDEKAPLVPANPWVLTAEERKGIDRTKKKKKIKNKKLKVKQEIYDKNDRKNYAYEELKNSLRNWIF